MTTTVQRRENSKGIRIPKTILDTVCWNENDELELSLEGETLIIQKVRKRKTIEELFKDFDGKYEPRNLDWGEPAGREAW